MQCRPQVDVLLANQEKTDEWWKFYPAVPKTP
jgi:hypothetical protein